MLFNLLTHSMATFLSQGILSPSFISIKGQWPNNDTTLSLTNKVDRD